jgi:hypothetical protein
MNIDELICGIRNCSPEREVQGFADWIADWKVGDTTIDNLRHLGDKYLGTAWLSNDALHEAVYALWQRFVHEKIDRIHGMAMNERLFTFGLVDRFDSAPAGERLKFYERLLANP